MIKKIITISLIALSLVGCSKSTPKADLVCTNGDTTVTITPDSKDQVQNIKFVEMVRDVSKEEYDQELDTMNAFYEAMMETPGLSISSSHADTTVTLISEFDYSKLDSQALDELIQNGLLSSDLSVEGTIDSFETKGFSCQ